MGAAPGESAGEKESILIFSAAPQDGKQQLYMYKPGEAAPVQVTDNGVTNIWWGTSRDAKKMLQLCSEWQNPAYCLLDPETKTFTRLPGNTNGQDQPNFSFDDKNIVTIDRTNPDINILSIYNISTKTAASLTDLNAQLALKLIEPNISRVGWVDNDTIWFVVEYQGADHMAYDIGQYQVSSKQLILMGLQYTTDYSLYPWASEEGKTFWRLRTDGTPPLHTDPPTYNLSILRTGATSLGVLATNANAFHCGDKELIARQAASTVNLSLFDPKTEGETPAGSVEKMPWMARCSADGKKAILSFFDGNKIAVVDLAAATVIQNDVGNGVPSSINTDGSYALVMPAANQTPLDETYSPVNSIFLINTATGEKTEIPNVIIDNPRFISDKIFAYTKIDGEKRKLVLYHIDGKPEEEIADIKYWWGEPNISGGGKYFAFYFVKDDANFTYEIDLFSDDTQKTVKIPPDQLKMALVGWSQMPKGEYEKWKAFAGEQQGSFVLPLKDNRPPTCNVSFNGVSQTHNQLIYDYDHVSRNRSAIDLEYSDDDFDDAFDDPFTHVVYLKKEITCTPDDRIVKFPYPDLMDYSNHLAFAAEASDVGKSFDIKFTITDSKGVTGTCGLTLDVTRDALPPPPPAVCGDGVKADTEECDEMDGIDATTQSCTATCKIHTFVCGDNVVEGTEICDDGNRVNGDNCDNNCQKSMEITLRVRTVGPFRAGNSIIFDGIIQNGMPPYQSKFYVDGTLVATSSDPAPSMSYTFPTARLYTVRLDIKDANGVEKFKDVIVSVVAR